MKKIVFIPNKGARLGHQFVEWLRGYIFCRNNNYSFYHHGFLENSKGMDDILNLSHRENLFQDWKGKMILRDQMPLNDYLQSGSEDLYVYDFFLPNDFIDLGEIDDNIRGVLREKYFLNNKRLPHDSISVHIRRDDILKGDVKWGNRYISIEYFISILGGLFKDHLLFEVKVFSSNVDEDFYKIKTLPYKNISIHINGDIKTALNHMINSRVLVTSSSGLSFIASIISDDNNTKICPMNFWHKWPKECIISNYEL